MIEWIWPWMMILMPLPWLAMRFLPVARTQESALRAPFFSEWRQLSEGQGGVAANSKRLPLIVLWLLWFCLLLAAARPVWIGEAIELPNSGRDLMLAVDISGSMRAEDMQLGNVMARRIDAVKQLGAEFIERRSGDRLGLILFGTNAYVQSPLSFDTATVQRFLLEAQIGFAGQETAIGDAIGLAVKRLRDRPAASRVMILLTDGQDTASSVTPKEAAQLAQTLDIKIYTIGIGADEMTLPGRFGSRQINPSAELDEEGLQEIAKLTGGQYFRARNPQDLANIYALVNQLEPVEQATQTYRPRQALGYLPLLIALALGFTLALFQWFSAGGLSLTRSPSGASNKGGAA